MSPLSRPASAGETREVEKTEEQKQKGYDDTTLRELEQIGTFLTRIGTQEAEVNGNKLKSVIAYLRERFATKSKEERWETACKEIRHAVEKLGQDINNQSVKISTVSKAATTTWATVAAGGRTPSATSPRGQVRGPIIPPYNPRKAKAIIVGFKEQKDRELIEKIPNEELLSRIKRGNDHENTKEVIAVRKLQSGDLLLHTATEEARRRLEGDGKWLQRVAGSATAKRQRFPVFVHGTEVARYHQKDQKESKKLLEEQNRSLHPELEVLEISWPKFATTSGKRYSSMVVDVASAEQANRLIVEGLLDGGELKVVELFDRNCRVMQCFRCQEYGHSGKSCKKPASCGHCAGNHMSEKM